MRRLIIEDGLREHFLLDDNDSTVYALMTLFSKHPKLVSRNTSAILSDLITTPVL
jgi:hypothetical protein